MQTIKIGYDDNLGLPNDFATYLGCDTIAYHDLSQMLAGFKRQEFSAMFIPAGTLPYMDGDYQIFSQSLFGPEQKMTLQSNLVSSENVSLENIPDFVLGRVNEYCTTSFWSPMIYLMNYLPKKTRLNFQNTNGFRDMLDKTAAGVIDCAMVWDIIMKQDPKATKTIHQICDKNDLPTPIIVGTNDFPSDKVAKLNQFKTKDQKSFFTGFQAPDMNSINKFRQDMHRAADYFTVA